MNSLVTIAFQNTLLEDLHMFCSYPWHFLNEKLIEKQMSYARHSISSQDACCYMEKLGFFHSFCIFPEFLVL